MSALAGMRDLAQASGARTFDSCLAGAACESSDYTLRRFARTVWLWNSKEFGVWVRRGLGMGLASAACMRDEAGVSRAIGDAKSVG